MNTIQHQLDENEVHSPAQETQQTIYQVKHGLLSDYLRQQLKSPAIRMTLA